MQYSADWNPKTLLGWSEGFFRDKGIPTPRLDAELLLAHVLACQRIDLYLQFDRPLTVAELSAFRELVPGRAHRTPVAYLLGEAGFRNLMLAVGPGCLIPRPETETLVEVALEALLELRAALHPAPEPAIVLEWGTGSGAIPLALCAETEGLACISCELSAEAMAWANTNRRRHESLLAPRQNTFRLVRCRGFDAVAPDLSPHLVIANPPYIASGDFEQLQPEVAVAEPRAALDGGMDGLACYPEIFAHAARRLAAGGRLVIEIGAGQGKQVRELLENHPPLRFIELREDSAGHERVLCAERPAGDGFG